MSVLPQEVYNSSASSLAKAAFLVTSLQFICIWVAMHDRTWYLSVFGQQIFWMLFMLLPKGLKRMASVAVSYPWILRQINQLKSLRSQT